MDTDRLTPMLAQYRQIKARFPDAIGSLASATFSRRLRTTRRTAARELELVVLTSRSFAKGVRLPMAGCRIITCSRTSPSSIDRGL